MRLIITYAVALLLPACCYGDNTIDSLENIIRNTSGSEKITALSNLKLHYISIGDLLSLYKVAKRIQEYAKSIGDQDEYYIQFVPISTILSLSGSSEKARIACIEGLEHFKNTDNYEAIVKLLQNYKSTYGDYDLATDSLNYIFDTYSPFVSDTSKYKKWLYHSLGDIASETDIDKAIEYYHKVESDDPHVTTALLISLSEAKNQIGELDSAFYYIKKALKYDEVLTINTHVKYEAYYNLASFFEQSGNKDSAYHYMKIASFVQDTAFEYERQQEVFKADLKEQFLQMEFEETKRSDDLTKGIIAIVVFFIITFFYLSHLVRTNRRKARLEAQRAEMEKKNADLSSQVFRYQVFDQIRQSNSMEFIRDKFELLHPGVIEQLQFRKLTEQDINLIILDYLDFSHSEQCITLHLTKDSLNTSRSRTRKKLAKNKAFKGVVEQFLTLKNT